MTKAQSTPVCTTCPRPTDGAAQCDLCLLRRAHQVHRTQIAPPRLALHAEERRQTEDQRARAALLARAKQTGAPLTIKRKIGAPRRRLAPLQVGDIERGWVVLEVEEHGVYRVRCPYCTTQTHKTRTAMGRVKACLKCSRKRE